MKPTPNRPLQHNTFVVYVYQSGLWQIYEEECSQERAEEAFEEALREGYSLEELSVIYCECVGVRVVTQPKIKIERKK